MGYSLTFVEKARHEAENGPIHPGDEQANALLAEARRRIYHWPTSFGGFTCRVQATRDQESWEGRLHAVSSSRYRIDWDLEPDRELKGWMAYHLGELLAHREAPERSRMASRSGVLWGDDEHPLYGQQILFPDDPMQSFYRIKDGRICQIGRCYPKTRFVINIPSHHDFSGRFAAQAYNAFYWRRDSGELCKSEAYYDSYTKVQEIWLPSARTLSTATSEGLSERRLLLSDHRLLDAPPELPPVKAGRCPFHQGNHA